MNEGDFRVPPSPRTVADLVDAGGMTFARERWGWLDVSTLSSLAVEGRRAAGRARMVGDLHALQTTGHVFLNPAWDGAEVHSPYLPTPLAAAALGLSPRTVTMGTA
ncbi:hypothetical protein [uncultured Methylobacterium sp.]|uniref:hypothetical protein n=1 Tax=uncultured Methylobacterium sp. TaxID=157278 RepID=UPI0035CBD7FF